MDIDEQMKFLGGNPDAKIREHLEDGFFRWCVLLLMDDMLSRAVDPEKLKDAIFLTWKSAVAIKTQKDLEQMDEFKKTPFGAILGKDSGEQKEQVERIVGEIETLYREAFRPVSVDTLADSMRTGKPEADSGDKDAPERDPE